MPGQPTPSQSNRKRVRLHLTTPTAALWFAGLAALFYAPILLGLRTFPDGDFTHHFLPFSLFQQGELLAGRLPVWNPFTYGGHPFLADVQAAVFYPLSNLLLGLTLPWTAPGARLYFLEVEAIVQVALAGFFIYLWVCTLTGNRWSGVVAGTLFAFSGYLTGYPPLQLAVLRTAIWLPLILWLLLRGVMAPQRWRWWIGLGVALAVAFLAGHAQTFLFVGYATAAWALLLVAARAAHGAGRSRNLLHVLLGLAGAGAIALGLSAAQLLPSLEFAGLSVRANVDYAFVSGGFPVQDTWQALLPGILTQYSPLYIGVVGLGLAWLGAWGAGRRPSAASGPDAAWKLSPRVGAGFLLGVVAVALLLSYGDNGWLYPLFYRFAPGWNLFRGQERAAFLVVFGLSGLAGYGAAALTTLPQRQRAWLATAFAGLVIGAVYLFGLLWQLPGRTAISQGQFLLVAAVTVALVSTFAVMLRLPGWSRRRTIGLTVLAVANLFWANIATNLDQFDPARKAILPPEVEALQAAVAESPGANRGLAGRVYNEFRVYEDYGMRAGLEDVWGSSPLRLARYAALFDQFPLDRMWRLLGVDHVLTWRGELFEPSDRLAEFPQATDATYVHRLTEANPRAWLATTVRVAPDAEAVKLLADHTFDLETIALVAGPDRQPPPAQAPAADVQAEATPGGTIQMQALAPAHLRVSVDSPQAGLLIIAENWMPGWHVENTACGVANEECQPANGTALNLPLFTPMRADLTLVGVPVPAGVAQFDLVYRPDSVRVGLWIGGLMLVIVLVVGVVRGWGWRRR